MITANQKSITNTHTNKTKQSKSSHCGTVVMNLTSIHKDLGSIPGPDQWAKGCGIFMSCGVDCRHGLDLALLGRAAVALI